MSDYLYEADEAPAEPAGRRIRFDPTRVRGEDYFTRASRHSRTVRWLKIALPVVAAAGVASFFVAMQLAPNPDEAVITLAGVNVEKKSVEMKAPHISGFEGSKRAYEIKATRAIQDLNNPKVVTLEEIVAKFGIGDGTTANVNAAIGVFDGTTKGLTLRDGITLKTSNGYEAKLVEAAIDMEKGHLATEKPVTIKGAEGSISANSMEIVDRGAKIRFGGGVSVTFVPKDDDKGDEAEPAPVAEGGKPAVDKEAKPSGGSS